MMRSLSLSLFYILFAILSTNQAVAHQPVMDMAPRWQGGYGFQLRQETHYSDKLLSGESEVDNPFGQEQRISTSWLETIYTFRREVRLVVKIPYLDQQRTTVTDDGALKQAGRGLGDIIIAVPLKRYVNETSSTSNIAFTPSIRLPTGSTDEDFPVGDGSTDLGASFSVSFEKADLYQFYDLFFWRNNKGEKGMLEGNEAGLDINIGWHPYHNNMDNQGVFVMLDVSARVNDRGRNTVGVTGGKRISMGPIFVFYRKGVMFRAEYKTPIYENLFATQVSRGSELNIGIGCVF
ncbi:MAG: hypothetical protein JKY50_12470 [Oleispira sp.]|nr:hypothetical protein [Oleispira sp.]MBL4882164.1 hypothetical protein [Oleispira sp.]